MKLVQGVSSGFRPLIVHIVYRFDTGGLENGVVNLINNMPAEAFRHMVISLTDISDFSERVSRSDVEFYCLGKRPGHGVKLYPRIFRILRKLRPAIVHTRNLAALEAVVPAWLARVPVRIHGEHGRDVGDLRGQSLKFQFVRKFYRPFVSQYVALSQDLAGYMIDRIGISPAFVTQIYNGVDLERFNSEPSNSRASIEGCPFKDGRFWLIGTVGRMQSVKDQVTLARAFVELLSRRPDLRSTVRLVMVGEGPLRARSIALLEAAGFDDLAWLPGERTDVANVLRGLDCFVLPSLAEGISNTILEAMACALPVIATDVGGNAELVNPGETGEIVPPADPGAIAHCLAAWADAPYRARAMGLAGRAAVERRFSMGAMVQAYQNLYDRQLATVSPLSDSIFETHVRNNRNL